MTVEAAAASRRWGWQPWAGAALAVLLLALVYHRTVAVLWRTWHGNDNYSHGPLVPLVSVALAWLARDRWRAAPETPDTRGLMLVAFACLLQVAGVRSDIFALESYSIVVMAFGLCLTFQGPARTRVMAFPLGFLVFMMVFPPLVVLNLSYALKESHGRGRRAAGRGVRRDPPAERHDHFPHGRPYPHRESLQRAALFGGAAGDRRGVRLPPARRMAEPRGAVPGGGAARHDRERPPDHASSCWSLITSG